MTAEAIVHMQRGHGPLLALVGNPNCGKTALFNRLTGQPPEGGQLRGRDRGARKKA